MMSDEKRKRFTEFRYQETTCAIWHADFSPHLCGYVEVQKDHPLFQVPYGEHSPALAAAWEARKDRLVGDMNPATTLLVAGSGGSKATPEFVFEVHGSLTYSGDLFGDGRWWFGFDTNHRDDGPGEQNIPYVTEQCERLAEQLVLVRPEEKQVASGE